MGLLGKHHPIACCSIAFFWKALLCWTPQHDDFNKHRPVVRRTVVLFAKYDAGFAPAAGLLGLMRVTHDLPCAQVAAFAVKIAVVKAAVVFEIGD